MSAVAAGAIVFSLQWRASERFCREVKKGKQRLPGILVVTEAGYEDDNERHVANVSLKLIYTCYCGSSRNAMYVIFMRG